MSYLGGHGLWLFTCYHVDDFPRAILCTKLASDTNFLVHHHDAVHAHVSMFLRVFGAWHFVDAIHWTKLDADLAARAAFLMHDRYKLSFLLFLRRSGYDLLDCLCGRDN